MMTNVMMVSMIVIVMAEKVLLWLVVQIPIWFMCVYVYSYV